MGLGNYGYGSRGYGNGYYGGYGYGNSGFINRPYYSGYGIGYGSPYYSNGMRSSFYSAPYYPPAVLQGEVTTQQYAMDPAYGQDSANSSFYNNPNANGFQPVKLTILLPTPDAQLWIGDNAMSLQGNSRTFESPPIESDKDFIYSFRTTWMENGSPMERTRQTTVRAGQSITVDLRNTATPAAPVPRTVNSINNNNDNNIFNNRRDNKANDGREINNGRDNNKIRNNNKTDNGRDNK